MKVEEKEICPKCERIGKLTRDHKIPQVFVRQCRRFGVQLPPRYTNIERMCAACNLEKGHDLDLGDEVTLYMLQHLASEIMRREANGETVPRGKLARYEDDMREACTYPLQLLAYGSGAVQ